MTPRDWHLHLSRRLGSTLSFEQFTEVWNRVLDPQPLISPNRGEEKDSTCQKS